MAEAKVAEGKEQANARLLSETASQLPECASSLERSSKLIPSEEEFHFYSNFNEFREPVQNLQDRVASLLSSISSLSVLPRAPALPTDPDDLLTWLVDMQDEVLEQVDCSFDLFKKERAEQGLPPPEHDGFMYQKTRKKRRCVVSKEAKTKIPARDEGMKVKMMERCPVPFHVWTIPRPQEKFDVPVDNSNTPFRHPKRPLGSSENINANKPAHPLQEELQNLAFEGIPTGPKEPTLLSETPFTFIDTSSTLKEVAAKLSLEREIAVDLEHHHFRSFQGLTCLMQISTRSEDFIIDTLELRSLIGPQLNGVFANPAIEKVMHGAKLDILWLQRDFGIYVCNLFDTGQAAKVLELESFSLAHLLEHFCGVLPDKRYQMADWRLRPLSVDMVKYAREDTHYLLYVGDQLKKMLTSTQCKDWHEPLLEVYKRSRDICLKLYEKEITTETSYLQVYGLEGRNFHSQQLAVLAGLYSWRDKVARVEDESTGFVLPNNLLLKLAEEMPDDVNKLRAILNGRHMLVARNIATVVDVIKKAKLMVPRLESKEEPRLQGGNTIPSALFEEIPFSESSLDPTAVMQDKILLQKDDENSNMNVEKIMGSQATGVQKDNQPQYLENIEGASVSNPTCKSVVLKRATRSAFFQKHQKEGKPENKPEVWQESNYEVLFENMATEKGKAVDLSSKDGGAERAPSAAVIKRASASFLFGKQKKLNKVVQEVHDAPSVAKPLEGKQVTNTQGSQIEDLTFILGNRTSLQTKTKDLEQAEAKCKAEKIRTSFSLPFHSFDGAEKASVRVIKDEKVNAAHLGEQKRETSSLEMQTEKLITIETDVNEVFHDGSEKKASDSVRKDTDASRDGSQHRLWWPDTLNSGQDQFQNASKETDTCDARTELPLSLSQRYRAFHYNKEGLQSESQISKLTTKSTHDMEPQGLKLGDRSHSPSGNHHVNQSHDERLTPFVPFDYASAKQRIVFRGFRESMEGTDSSESMRFDEGSGKNRLKSKETFFDPQRKIKEFKPEGISPGKRRQVFPQTGNRTGIFK